MQRKIFPVISFVLVFISSFILYIFTLAPSVTFIDSGELSAVASTLGIAHPTGYPLFTLIGYLFTKLPIGSTEVYRLNLMSAFFCSLGAAVFSSFIFFVLNNIFITNSSKKVQQVKSKAVSSYILPEIIILGFSIFASLILAFSNTFWDTANAVEVYSIHTFFIAVLMLVFIKAIFTVKSSNETFLNANRYYLIFAFLLGLSFTNHLTTILLAPACLILFFAENFSDRKKLFMLLGCMAVCFLLGFSVYLYLPIRANMNPELLWGNPYNLERFIWHFTGKQFSVWIFSAQGSVALFLALLALLTGMSVYGIKKAKSIYYPVISFVCIVILASLLLSNANEIIAKQFTTFYTSLWTEYGTGLILFALLGVYRLSVLNTKLFYFTVLTFFACVFYSVNYDIHDIDSYFLLSYMTVPVWIAFGALSIYEKFKDNLAKTFSKSLFVITLLALNIITIKVNYEQNDESKNVFVEEFTMNIFRNTEPNSIIISSQWDFWVSSSWYFHFVKKIRPDIVVIDKELLRRSWYFKFLERNYPEIYNNSKSEIEKFLVELDKFEHNIPYDQATIMKAFSDLMTSFVTKNPNRRVYTTWEIEQKNESNKLEKFATEYIRVPDGLMFRLIKTDNPESINLSDYKIYDFRFTPTNKKDYYHTTLMVSYASMLTNSANYLSAVNRLPEAKKYLELALLAKPNLPEALELKRRLNL